MFIGAQETVNYFKSRGYKVAYCGPHSNAKYSIQMRFEGPKYGFSVVRGDMFRCGKYPSDTKTGMHDVEDFEVCVFVNGKSGFYISDWTHWTRIPQLVEDVERDFNAVFPEDCDGEISSYQKPA